MQTFISNSLYYFLLVLVAYTSLPYSKLVGQRIWDASDGQWFTSSNWSGGVPSGSADAQFVISENSDSDDIAVTIGDGENLDATVRGFRVLWGKSVTLNMTEGSSLTGDSSNNGLWRVGWRNSADYEGVGSANLLIRGPESGSAIVRMGELQIGAGGQYSGNTLEFSGAGLTVEQTGVRGSVVGRFGSDNKMIVSGGAKVTRHLIEVSSNNADGGKERNSIQVTGENSHLDTNEYVYVGRNEGRSNYVVVSGDNASFQIGTALNIGMGSNRGGNHLIVDSGGTVRVGGDMTIGVYSNNSGDNDGTNWMRVGNGGTFTASTKVDNSGLIQLSSGGSIFGKSIEGVDADLGLNILQGARFEAEGNGLGANVTTAISESATLAVGIRDIVTGERSGPSFLTLQSVINFEEGGILEVTLFEDGAMDEIHFVTGAELNGYLTLSLLVEAGMPTPGQSWTLFSGETSLITASIDLSSLDTSVWDVSRFNQDGGWELAAIPEVKQVSLVLLSLACIFITFRRLARKG